MTGPVALDAAVARTTTVVRATVAARGVETSYLRAGRGTPVLLLAPSLEAPALHAVIGTLARDYLVVAAAPPGGEPVSDAWLAGFLEGLGCAPLLVMKVV